jgi:hypothetical protein
MLVVNIIIYLWNVSMHKCFMSMLVFTFGLMMTSMHILCVLVSFHGLLRTCRCSMNMLMVKNGLMMTFVHFMCVLVNFLWPAKDL